MTSSEEIWVITLDGPAGSGKSTTAQLVADTLAFVYLDTGALYRAVTVLALERDVPASDEAALAELVEDANLSIYRNGTDQIITSAYGELTGRLRTAAVDRGVSAVSAVPSVRRAMLQVQRDQRRAPGLVAEGRDLGTVVFPDAQLKIYLVADLDVRAQRRALQREAAGEATTVEAERLALQRRDELDSGRQIAPLRQAEDALIVDTTFLTISGQVARVVELFRERARP